MADAKLLKTILVRVVKAALAGFLAYLTSYLIPKMLLSGVLGLLERSLPVAEIPSPLALLKYFAIITVFYTVAIELTRDTVLEHFFAVGRGLTMLFFFIYASGGGIISFSLPLSSLGLGGAGQLAFTLDISKVLMVLIGIDILDIGRSVINAVNFLSERAEREVV